MLGYCMASCVEKKPSNIGYSLHMHRYYELYMFLEGDAKFIVEGDVYSLDPGDIIIIRKNVMHRIYHNSDARHSRIVIDIHPEFFELESCPELETQFLTTDVWGDKISAEVARKSGIYDAFMRLKKYTGNFVNFKKRIAKSVLIELLCLINEVDTFTDGDMNDERTCAIIAYINNNFTKSLTLDDIEKEFFISKYHLCRIFSKATGMSVHRYITNKRLAWARDRMLDGLTADEAATMSGFNSYSAFYRAYCKEYGKSPRAKE